MDQKNARTPGSSNATHEPLLLEFCLAKLQVMACHVMSFRQRRNDSGEGAEQAEICLALDGGVYLIAMGTDGLHGANGHDLHYVVHAHNTLPSQDAWVEIAQSITRHWDSEVVEIRNLAQTVLKACKAGHQTLKLELWPGARKVLIKSSTLPPGQSRQPGKDRNA
jgi:hypothetical protein